MKIKISAFLSLGLALLSGQAFAQAPGPYWKTTLTTGNPPLRMDNPGTASGTHMYVFGGLDAGGAARNDLWSFDGAAWTLMTADGAPGSPSARSRAAVSWNFFKNRLMVFGGMDAAGGYLGDTWEWDPITNTWAQITPTGPAPSARWHSSLTADLATGQMLLFGGESATAFHGDTWLFDGADWTEVNLSGPGLPKGRSQHTVAGRVDMFDSVLSQGYGGPGIGGGFYKDTWIWDGTTWSQVDTGFTPTGAVDFDTAYDTIRRRLIFVGGGPGTGSDIFELDSDTNKFDPHYTDPAIGKVKRYFLAYVSGLGKTYKFGGESDNPATPPDWTYEYQTDYIATIAGGGTGCAGAGGVVSIGATTDLPWLGGTLSAIVSGVSASELAILLVGFNDTSWQGFPLPLDLGALLGAPGCSLYLAPSDPFIEVLGFGPAPALYSKGLPTTPALAGAKVFLQGMAWNLGTGYATSGYLTATLGAK